MSVFPTSRKYLAAFTAVFFVFGCGQSQSTGGDAELPPEKAAVASVNEDDAWIGEADAPVTIVEYASVTCSHCGNFHKSTFDKAGTEEDLLGKYINSGKVKYVFREILTGPVQLSLSGFYLARCAQDLHGSQGYYKVVDPLYKNQDQWILTKQDSVGRRVVDFKASNDALARLALSSGIADPEFRQCLADVETFLTRLDAGERNLDGLEAFNELFQEISAGADAASESYGITGTPSFVVNGQKLNLHTMEAVDEALGPLTADE